MRSHLLRSRFYFTGFFTMKDRIKLYNLEIKITQIVKDAHGVYVELLEPLEYPGRFGQPSDFGCIAGIEIKKIDESASPTKYYLEKEPDFKAGDRVIFTLQRVRENQAASGDVDDFDDGSLEDCALEEAGRKKFD